MLAKLIIGIICFVGGTVTGVGLTSCLVAGKRADEWLEKQMMEERK